jgi:hypothetical protein
MRARRGRWDPLVGSRGESPPGPVASVWWAAGVRARRGRWRPPVGSRNEGSPGDPCRHSRRRHDDRAEDGRHDARRPPGVGDREQHRRDAHAEIADHEEDGQHTGPGGRLGGRDRAGQAGLEQQARTGPGDRRADQIQRQRRMPEGSHHHTEPDQEEQHAAGRPAGQQHLGGGRGPEGHERRDTPGERRGHVQFALHDQRSERREDPEDREGAEADQRGRRKEPGARAASGSSRTRSGPRTRPRPARTRSGGGRTRRAGRWW